MDVELNTAHTETPRRRGRGAEERIRQLISRHRAELGALKTQVEYLQRVATMLIPLVPKPIVARILQDAKGENKNVRSR